MGYVLGTAAVMGAMLGNVMAADTSAEQTRAFEHQKIQNIEILGDELSLSFTHKDQDQLVVVARPEGRQTDSVQLDGSTLKILNQKKGGGGPCLYEIDGPHKPLRITNGGTMDRRVVPGTPTQMPEKKGAVIFNNWNNNVILNQGGGQVYFKSTRLPETPVETTFNIGAAHVCCVLPSEALVKSKGAPSPWTCSIINEFAAPSGNPNYTIQFAIGMGKVHIAKGGPAEGSDKARY